MRYIDQETLEVLEENMRLRKISDEKYKIWEIAAERGMKISLAEYNKTRPLFDEAMREHNKWQEHSDMHAEKLLIQRDD